MNRRDECVVVSRSNGAYLIEYIGENATDMTTDEVVSAASSLVRAKEVARDIAASYGYGPAWRWRPAEDGWTWWLAANWIEEDG